MSIAKRYAAAVIRAHTGRTCADWTAEELLDTLLVVPASRVSLEEFKAIVGAEAEPEPDVEEMNAAGIAAMDRLNVTTEEATHAGRPDTK